MTCMHDLAINKRLLAVVLPPHNPLFSFTRCSLTDVYRRWSPRTENDLQYFSRPGSCCRYHPQTRSALGGTLVRLPAAVQTRKNPFFHSVQTDWCYTDSGPAEPTTNYSASPGPDLPTDATPRTRSVLEGPAPYEGTPRGFRRTFQAQGLREHVAGRARTAAPRPKSTPQTSTRSFVSRRHKSRGDPRYRTGFQCG